jgi:hypothetical protein
MTPPSDLARCSHCDCLFAAAASDEIFFHATRGCRRARGTANSDKRVHQTITAPKRSFGS